MNKELTVSIIIPTFNRASYLCQAIDSVLRQTYDNLEVIVSDNASTDNTEEVIHTYRTDRRFRYFRNNENIGMVNNWRNSLMEHATGDYFILLSDDDYLVDDTYIANAVHLIKNNPGIVMVYANGYILYEDTQKMVSLDLPYHAVEDGKKIFLTRGRCTPQDFTLCNILFNRELAVKLNAFTNQHNLSCDSELFLKMCLYGNVGVIKDLVSVYRIHPKNLFKSLSYNVDYLINNLDCSVEPYLLAKKLALFTDSSLDRWAVKHVLLGMIDTLKKVYLYNNEHYADVCERIKCKYGQLYQRAILKFLPRIIKFKTEYFIKHLLGVKQESL